MSKVTLDPGKSTALITGCGAPRGIARAVARRLLDSGWNVAVADVSDQVLDFGSELENEYPEASVAALVFDVSDEEQVASAFARIAETMPPLGGVVNVAGIACPTPLDEITGEEWDRVMAVNTTGPMWTMKYGSRLMREKGVGRIVNFSSITALDGGGTFSKFAYAAAKAAVIGLTRGGARELGIDGITVNAILPGPIDTDIMGGKLTDERKVAMSSNISLGRIGQPEEVAAAVDFFLSDGAGFVNGVSMNVDGGKHMH